VASGGITFIQNSVKNGPLGQKAKGGHTHTHR